MTTTKLQALSAAFAAAAALTSTAAAADPVPQALAGKLIYAVPARISAAPATLEQGSATYDVFIDGRTGYAFVRTPRGWTLIRDIRSDAGPAAANVDSSRQ